MYEQRFGFKRRPFPPTPDDSLYYPATGHERALAALLRALGEDEGFALLTGLPGSGKTLLGYCLQDRLGADVNAAFLANSHFADRTSLLQAMLFDWRQPYEGSEQALRLRLTEFLLENVTQGRRALLVLDEAHHLASDLLEELRLLGNLEAGGKKAFQVVLLAQPSILDTLAEPELTALCQRLMVRCHLDPLPVEEAADYLLHQTRLAGGKPEKVFDETAVAMLARGTHGIPRILNQGAHQALVLADTAQMDKVDAEAAMEALALLGLEADETLAEAA
ncbi:MAG: AAA family ATPase [Gemmataceae bacterium]|nr:AAA family ATPase [Gemmataceae bacterium]MCI0741067.1 AAA family ATPase [Gemmataceae bacterium]